MSNFSELLLDIMDEKGKSIKDLEESKIIGKNTFYIFSKTYPSLNTIIKIANFLNVSIDYLLDKSTENKFKPYKLEQNNFYNTLSIILKKNNISQTKLCSDLQISRTNFSRWKNGTQPSLEKLILISTYLNCSIDDLLEQ